MGFITDIISVIPNTNIVNIIPTIELTIPKKMPNIPNIMAIITPTTPIPKPNIVGKMLITPIIANIVKINL